MSDQLFEHAVRDWLDDGSDRTPSTAIEAVLLAVRTTPQERALRIPRVLAPARFSTRLAAVAVLAAILAATALMLVPGGPFSPQPPPTQSTEPSASPAASAADLVDAGNWIAYTSERFGFDIKRPPDWSESPARRDWTMADAAKFASGHSEYFELSGPEGFGVIVTAWSVAVDAGTTAEAWIATYCPLNTEPCDGIQARADPITMDGHPGTFVQFLNDSQAFFLVDDRMYVVGVWRPDIDQSTRQYGSSSRLLRTFISTMTLRPGGPMPLGGPPALTESFTSERYGYSIDYPATWTVAPADNLFVPDRQVDNWDDVIRSPGQLIAFSAVSASVPDSVDVDDWISVNLNFNSRIECAPARSTLGSIVIDGQAASIRTSCGEVEAKVVLDGRAYVFTIVNQPSAAGRALFEAMMATVSLTPETAEVAPSPAAS
jgi:hypothetical protein